LGGGGSKWRYFDPVFEKLDLRVWNSVYADVPWQPQIGLVGVGWGFFVFKNSLESRIKYPFDKIEASVEK
jgi:hypothetical protein